MQPLCKIAMVTGAASGFGLATAKRLLAIGYKVACCDTAFSHSTPDEAFLDQLEEPGERHVLRDESPVDQRCARRSFRSFHRSLPFWKRSDPHVAKRRECLSTAKST